jgi:hypothetical protein
MNCTELNILDEFFPPTPASKDKSDKKRNRRSNEDRPTMTFANEAKLRVTEMKEEDSTDGGLVTIGTIEIGDEGAHTSGDLTIQQDEEERNSGSNPRSGPQPQPTADSSDTESRAASGGKWVGYTNLLHTLHQ